MTKKTLILTSALAAAAISIVVVNQRVTNVEAADHLDGPAVSMNKGADLTDLYAWMWDDAGVPSVALVLAVNPIATAADAFPENVHYAFHIDRGNVRTEVICQFESTDNTAIRCWVGDDVTNKIISGDPTSDATPLEVDGIKVFAGLRKDPFAFNSLAFGKVQTFVDTNKAGLTADIDVAGCFDLSEASGNDANNRSLGETLVACLTTQCDANIGEPQSPPNAMTDFFAELNVLALTVSLPLTEIAGADPEIRVYASTHNR